jgi:hypothetical protein
MRTRDKTSPSFTDQQLAGLERTDLKRAGPWTATMRKLITELRAEKRMNAALTRMAIRALARFSTLDRVKLGAARRQAGRVLVVDCPATAGERCVGETIVYADELVDLSSARCPVGSLHPRFEDVLEAALSGLPRRFQGMPGELSVFVRSITRYPMDLRSEVEALVNANHAEHVSRALSELREGLEHETHAAKSQEQETSSDGTGAPKGEIDLPF